MAIYFGNESAPLSVISDDRVVGEKDAWGTKQITSMIVNQIVVLACAKNITAASKPSELAWARWSE